MLNKDQLEMIQTMLYINYEYYLLNLYCKYLSIRVCQHHILE
jgi:hypothetical protein